MTSDRLYWLNVTLFFVALWIAAYAGFSEAIVATIVWACSIGTIEPKR